MIDFLENLFFRSGNKREFSDFEKPDRGETLLEAKGIEKSFPGVWRKLILDNVDFDLKAGEVHGLLGENGAGKTVLANILSGFYRQTKGEIEVRGEPVSIDSPDDALRLGIGMVHQELSLAKRFTVAENISLALPEPGFSHPLPKVERKTKELSQKYDFGIDPKAKVGNLSAGEQQRVEILKSLYYEPDILLLDEPASMLTPQETENLFSVINELANQNKGIMFITHKMEEAFEISDRISVLRLGKLIGTKKVSEADREELVDMMISREVPPRPERKPVEKGSRALEVKNLHVKNEEGIQAVKGASLFLRKGEILGIAGVAGNGQSELVECINGLRKAEEGVVKIFGEDMTDASPREIINKGVSYIPEDRREVGISEGLTAAENVVLKDYRNEPYCKFGNLDYSEITSHAKDLIDRHEAIVPDLWKTESRILSGGNIQRLILGRELCDNPPLIIAVHPTYGLDPRGVRYTHKLFLEAREQGTGILLVSENLDEILELSDRIAVMFEGEIIGTTDAEEAEKEKIGLMMTRGKRIETSNSS